MTKGDDRAEVSSDLKITTGAADDAQEELKPSSASEATNPQPDLVTKSEPQTKSKKRTYDQITKPAADEAATSEEKPASATSSQKRLRLNDGTIKEMIVVVSKKAKSPSVKDCDGADTKIS